MIDCSRTSQHSQCEPGDHPRLFVSEERYRADADALQAGKPSGRGVCAGGKSSYSPSAFFTCLCLASMRYMIAAR